MAIKIFVGAVTFFKPRFFDKSLLGWKTFQEPEKNSFNDSAATLKCNNWLHSAAAAAKIKSLFI